MSLTEFVVLVSAIFVMICIEWYCKEVAKNWRAYKKAQGW